MTQKRTIHTDNGELAFPLFIPVTTFGKKYPLDDLIRPYLPRLAQAVLVSHHYAKQMKPDERPSIPVLVDSGGFASLFENSRLVERDGLGVLKITGETGTEEIDPASVLDFQEEVADIAFTLDFPIPPHMENDRKEADRRQALTVHNALWALENRRRQTMPLYASIQAWDEESARRGARQLAGKGFDGFALGGMVPRLSNFKKVLSIVRAVREEVGDAPLHVFGIGKPELIKVLFKLGVDSVDSSSYVKFAAQGKLWGNDNQVLLDPSPMDRLHLALSNLAMATGASLPLSAHRPLFTAFAHRASVN